MAIPVPTIDDFDDATVIKTIRKVVNYIIGTLVPGHNSDISALNTTITNNNPTAVTISQGTAVGTIRITITKAGGNITSNDYSISVDTTEIETKLNELINSYNTMVTYVGADAELVTGTQPTSVTPLSTRQQAGSN